MVDANLNVLIGEIRRALGDAAKQPRFIRTVHGVGYAFCGNAADVKDAPLPAVARQPACWVVAKDRTFRLVGRREHRRAGPGVPPCGWIPTVSPAATRASSSTARRGGVWLEDLASKNGTRLRGAPCASVSNCRTVMSSCSARSA